MFDNEKHCRQNCFLEKASIVALLLLVLDQALDLVSFAHFEIAYLDAGSSLVLSVNLVRLFVIGHHEDFLQSAVRVSLIIGSLCLKEEVAISDFWSLDPHQFVHSLVRIINSAGDYQAHRVVVLLIAVHCT